MNRWIIKSLDLTLFEIKDLVTRIRVKYGSSTICLVNQKPNDLKTYIYFATDDNIDTSKSEISKMVSKVTSIYLIDTY